MTPRAAWLTTVTLAVSIVTYSLAVPGSEIVLLMLPASVLVRMFAFSREQALAPHWVVAAATFVAVVFAGLRVLRFGAEIEVLAEFVAILAVIKSMERWSARDDMQILIIAIFLILAAAISSSTLAIGVMLLIFVPLLGYTAMRLQVEGAIRFGQDRTNQRSRTQDSSNGHFLGTFVTALILVSGISIIAFVMLPRGLGDNTLGGLGRPVMGRATGFRNSVELGRGGLISNDETIVMEVGIRDIQTGASLGALGRVHYLRGNALTVYEDSKWMSESAGTGGKRNHPRRAGSGFTLGGSPRDATIEQTINLSPEASDGGVLFSLWQPRRVRFPEPQDSTVTIEHDLLTMRLDSSRSQLTTYTVQSAPETTRIDLGRHDPSNFAYFRANSVILGLAEAVMSDNGLSSNQARRSSPERIDAIDAIERWFTGSGEFTYTLDIQDAPADTEPIEWFLTEAKTGHCEYYASAMVAMCRSIGINARVVTGYVMAEYDTEKGSYIVRRSNAHAWVEAETSRGRWETFDPTPNVIDLHAPEESQLRFLRRVLDTIDGFWLSSVVSFNENNQMRLFGLESSDVGASVRGSGVDVEESRLVRAIIGALISGVSVFLIYRWYRNPKTGGRGKREIMLPKAAEEARRKLLRHWKAVGRERPSWIGLVAHAESDQEVELATMLSSAAYGSQDWQASHTARSRELLTQLAESR